MLAKRLKKSDCSYFESYFRAHPEGHQKAINLDQDKIRALFPRMVADTPRPYPVQVNWFFFSDTPIVRTQNISLSQKNWRLNSMPWVDVDVDPGDIVVCQMLSRNEPSAARLPTGVALALVRPGEPGFAWLDSRLPEGGFVNLSDDELIDAELDARSSVWQLIDFLTQGVVAMAEDVVPDASKSDIPKLTLRSIEQSGSAGRAINAVEKLRSAIGLGGETLVDAHLENKKDNGEISSYNWISKTSKLAPVDFSTSEKGVDLAIEVKTTKGSHETPFYISISELRAGRDLPLYEIWRVSSFDWTAAQLTGSIRRSNPAALVQETVEWIDTSPNGVDVPAVRFFPSVLTWTEPETASCAKTRVPSDTWEQDVIIAS